MKHLFFTIDPNRLIFLPLSGNQILPSVAWSSSVAALVTAYGISYDNHLLPEGYPMLYFPAFNIFLSTTVTIYSLMIHIATKKIHFHSRQYNVQTMALSLLLVFRTNTAYARWDEARKMKGLLLNRSRDLMRQVSEWESSRSKCLNI